jgi:hypothetical protein
MCEFYYIQCNKCSKKGKHTIKFCDKYGDKKMCLNVVMNLIEYMDMPEWGVMTMDLSSMRYFIEYPGTCYPDCPSEIMIPSSCMIDISNAHEQGIQKMS